MEAILRVNPFQFLHFLLMRGPTCKCHWTDHRLYPQFKGNSHGAGDSPDRRLGKGGRSRFPSRPRVLSKILGEISEKLALRCSKYFFDHSKARFTANSKLALQAQTLSLRPFRFAKNGYRKNLNSRSELVFLVFQRPQGALPALVLRFANRMTYFLK